MVFCLIPIDMFFMYLECTLSAVIEKLDGHNWPLYQFLKQIHNTNLSPNFLMKELLEHAAERH